jgi:hypothetical protein
VYLYQEIIKHKGSFNIWGNATFWLKWFEQETKDNITEYTDKEELFLHNLFSISEIMNHIKVDKKAIADLVINQLGVQFLKEVKNKIMYRLII